jgi:hypothetical protein
MKFYKGKFRPTNPSKYDGNFQNIVYRSLWERQLMSWCDKNSAVARWSSEETIVPYRCPTDNKMHRYFVDFKIKFTNGKTYLIEVKPKSQTIEPRPGNRKSKKFHDAVMTFVKNQAKWSAADEYCKDRGMIFEVWTEVQLASVGIKLLT